MPRFLLGLVCVVLLAWPSPAIARKWTDQQGRTIDADFVRVTNGSVVLVRGIQVFAVPFDAFSAADQDYVRQQVAPKKPAAADASKEADPASDDAATKPDSKDSSPAPAPGATPTTIPSTPASGAAPASKSATATDSGPRNWTDLAGRRVSAEFVSWTGKATDVVVLRKGTEPLSIAYSKFCVADQEYLRKKLADKAAPSAVNPATVAPKPTTTPLVTAPPPSVPPAKAPTTPHTAPPAAP